MSDDLPALQATLGFDAPRGLYGGVLGSTAKLADAQSTGVQAIAYAGCARATASDWNWDAGGQFSAFGGSHEHDYGELYAGLSWRRETAHLHWSPRYFGLDRATLYTDLDASRVAWPGVELAVHLGVLWPLTRPPGEYRASGHPVLDVRLAVGEGDGRHRRAALVDGPVRERHRLRPGRTGAPECDRCERRTRRSDVRRDGVAPRAGERGNRPRIVAAYRAGRHRCPPPATSRRA